MRIACALTLLVCAALTSAAADPSVKAYALNVNNPPAGAPKEIVSPAYTGVYMFIQVPGKQILTFDAAASKLALTDDKGTDLGGPKTLPGNALAIDKSKEQARLYVLGNKAPAAGATRARVKGELVLLCGTGEKTATVEKLALKDKEKATAGPVTFEVVVAKDKLTVTFKSDGASVKAVNFTTPDGKPLAQSGNISPSAPGGKVTQSATYTLPPKTEAVAIKLTYYEKTEAVKLAVDTDTGVGP
jgi:hypothetical protein